MAVIKRIDLERVEHRAIVLNLGDLADQAERLKAMARAEASGIVAAAKAERERLIEDARRVGHSEGLKAGHAEGQAKGKVEGRAAAIVEAKEALAAMEATWGKALDAFLTERNVMLDAARLDMLRLAVAATEKVTKRRIEVDASLVVDQMAAAIAEAAKGSSLVVRVSTADSALAREAMPGIVRRFGGSNAELREDANLARGSCVVMMAGGGMVDASIRTQLGRIAESLLPGEDAGRIGGGGETA